MTRTRTGRGFRAFWKGWFHNPSSVGAVVPSSRGLTRRMAAMLDPSSSGIVIELGAGTGVVTQALIERGISKDRLIVVEYMPEFVGYLRKRFPDVQILQGDAAQLGTILQQQTNRSLDEVYAIVSSLPLRSLPSAKSNEIVGEWKKLTHPQACVVQYTYSLYSWKHQTLDGFHRLRTRFAWWNLPPARIDLLATRK